MSGKTETSSFYFVCVNQDRNTHIGIVEAKNTNDAADKFSKHAIGEALSTQIPDKSMAARVAWFKANMVPHPIISVIHLPFRA